MKLPTKKIKVSLAILAMNERKASEILFPKIPLKSVDEVYVIDGNSTDGTIEFYKKKGIKVFTQKKRGLGAAVFEARSHCSTNAMILYHPDGNENPEDIGKIADALRLGYEFVIPSRMIKGGQNEEDDTFLKPRKWFNICFAIIINALWNKNGYVSEIVQGFRGINILAYDKLHLDTEDRTIDCQMVIRGLKYKLKFYEFPSIEGKRLFGDTNFKSIPTGYLNLKTFVREILDKSTYPVKA